MTQVLISVPSEWITQIDTISEFYCKSRMAFIREFLQEGIKRTAEHYQSAKSDLEEANQIFEKMGKEIKNGNVDKDSGGWKW